MNKSRFVALLLALCPCLNLGFIGGAGAAEPYWIKVNPSVTGPFTVDVTIETNIRESVTLAISLGLVGQKPQDTAIGTSFIKLPIVNGNGRVSIDGKQNVTPLGVQLPSGNYDVEVGFHPLWSENKAVASRLGITDSIEGKSVVKLEASGATVASVKKKTESQQWIMTNFKQNMPWDPREWKARFGSWKEIKYRGKGNPKIRKMYYFESIDMTLMVNALKREIMTYRMGLQYK